MKTLKIVTLFLIAAAFTACDNDPISDLMPPFGGYIWRITNSESTGGRLLKISLPGGEGVEGYPTPFDPGRNFDAAAGDGRVWVAGSRDDEYMQGTFIWELGGTYIDTYGCVAITWDGEYLWSTASSEFYRTNPDTGEYELMFTLEDYDTYCDGLAWDGTYIWAVYSPEEVIIQIDRNEGEVLKRIPSPAEASRGLTWDGGALWVNDLKSDRIYRVNPDDGSALGYLEMSPPGRLPPPAPYGLAFEFPSE
jgi:hypothetical protein